MKITTFALISAGFFVASLAGSAVWALILAAPFQWIWNRVVAPYWELSHLSYWDAAGFLGLVFIIRLAGGGFTISRHHGESE